MFKAIAPAISVIVTQAYVDHPDNNGSYFKVGDEVHISERQRQYYVVRNGEFYGGKMPDGGPAEHGSCDPEWVAECLSYGGFVNMADELPPVPDSTLYFSPTGRRQLELVMRRKSDFREHGIVELSIGGVFRKFRMDAATARDMAHDLYRMARQLEKDEQ